MVIVADNKRKDEYLKKIKYSSFTDLNKENRVFKGIKDGHDIIIDCVVEKDGKIKLIEIKDGDTFDTKKVAGEVSSLITAKAHLMKSHNLKEEDVSIHQIISGIKDYINYNPKVVNENIIINEPNLYDQPKYYQNTEFFPINPEEIVNC
jgi:hypothetical protein